MPCFFVTLQAHVKWSLLDFCIKFYQEFLIIKIVFTDEPYQPRNISLLNVTDSSFVLKTRFSSSKPILSAQNSYSSQFYFNNYVLPIESWIVKYKKASQSLDKNEKFSVKTFENSE